MPIQINPPELQGLAQLAGRRDMSLNLPIPGALGLQALQVGGGQQLARQQNALQAQDAFNRNQNAQQQMGLLSQGQQFAQQNHVADQAAAAQAAQLAQQNFQQTQGAQASQFGQTAGMAQHAQDYKEQQDKLAQDMAKVMDLKKDDIMARGGFASYLLMAMKGAQTPDQQNQIRTSALKEGLAKGFITEEEAKQGAAMPLSQFLAAAAGKVMQYGQANDFKDMMAAQAPAKGPAAGLNMTFDPASGQLASITQTPTAPTTSDLQKKVVTQDQMLNTLNDLKNTFNEKYFTYSGRSAKEISQVADKFKDMPIAGTVTDAIASTTTGMNKEDREKFINDSTQYLHSAGQMFQQYIQSLAGSRVSQERIDAFEKLFANPTMSPVEYKSGITQLLRDIATEKGINADILTKGLNVTPSVAHPVYSPDAIAAEIKRRGLK